MKPEELNAKLSEQIERIPASKIHELSTASIIQLALLQNMLAVQVAQTHLLDEIYNLLKGGGDDAKPGEGKISKIG